MPLAKVDLGSAIIAYLNRDSTLCNKRYDSPEAGIILSFLTTDTSPDTLQGRFR